MVKYFSGSRSMMGGSGMIFRPSFFVNRPCHQYQGQHCTCVEKKQNILALFYVHDKAHPWKSYKNTQIFLLFQDPKNSLQDLPQGSAEPRGQHRLKSWAKKTPTRSLFLWFEQGTVSSRCWLGSSWSSTLGASSSTASASPSSSSARRPTPGGCRRWWRSRSLAGGDEDPRVGVVKTVLSEWSQTSLLSGDIYQQLSKPSVLVKKCWLSSSTDRLPVTIIISGWGGWDVSHWVIIIDIDIQNQHRKTCIRCQSHCVHHWHN